ncbi:uncharacterized protein LOC129940270 [Eupeodes corollae]|uniref:uncharacterized protein LOC129940270 n=1 Tax=Eupeodes corollae TaxID=290404 RepID=UPI002493B71C|nr:uncharacterized protein LOC129940270 [Eupeodes corollae]
MKDIIHFRLAISTDKPAVLEFLREHYFPYETLTYSIEPKKQDSGAEEDMTNCVDVADRFCLLALYENQIVGARSLLTKGPDAEQVLLKKASEIPWSQYAKVLKILAKVERDANVFKKFNNFKLALHGNGLAVHKDFRGNGIGLKLYEKSMQIGKALGYSLFTCDCTSIYSARLCELMGMECTNVCKMEDYRLPGSDEQFIFPPAHQKYIKTYAKVVQ